MEKKLVEMMIKGYYPEISSTRKNGYSSVFVPLTK